MMKAVVLEKFGGVENLVEKEIPKPTITDNEVLVKVKAISLNPVDYKARQVEFLKFQSPMILGWDISGVVESVGSSVQKFKVGDEVFGMVNFPGDGRAYAEYVKSPEDHLAKKPKNISHSEAAATTLAALTAWQAFTHHGTLKKGDKILIHAAAGGVGHFAIQMAKHLGAYVIGTSSEKNKDFILGLGADEHLDYRNVKFEEKYNDIDFCLEAIAGDQIFRTIKAVKEGGTIITILPYPDEAQKEAEKKNQTCKRMMVKSEKKDIESMADLLEKGVLKPHIFKEYSFDQIKDAHLQLETSSTIGKVIVLL